ncbi:MAG: acylphosphatase [Solobacterium sp.]|nr:acylphosphatase [Solobacterium sp.]
MEQQVRIHYHFYGRVQGVGFRWTAMQAAEACRTTGWVRNESDGSVTMEVQGTRPNILKMLAMIESSRWIHITNTTKYAMDLDEDEREFDVKLDDWW